MICTKRKLIEMLERFPEDTQVQFQLQHDAEEGDLVHAIELELHATIEGAVVLVGDPYDRRLDQI